MQVARDGHGPTRQARSAGLGWDVPDFGNPPPTAADNPLQTSYSPHGRFAGGAFPVAVHFGKLHFAGLALGNISSYNGVPLFSNQGQRWIHFCTGQDAAFPTPPDDLSVIEQAEVDDFSLPSRAVVEEYLSLFRSSHLKLEFPVVDSVMFQDTIQLAYGSFTGNASQDSSIARACIFAFLSVMALFDGRRLPVTPRVDGDACAMKARHLLSPVPQALGLVTLQTALMLVRSPIVPSL